VSGVLGFPARREIGDCYIWGVWGGGGGGAEDLRGSGEALVRSASSSPYPVLLQHTHTLDVVQVRGAGRKDGGAHAKASRCRRVRVTNGA
jgi:hypothetical protein